MKRQSISQNAQPAFQALPKRAMILAAGLGTRMRPLSFDLPKPLMPLWNRSLLARHVDLLKSWGVQEILVNSHFGAADVIREAIALSSPDCRVSISHEPAILGTGGALQKAAWFFDNRPFWLLNADVVTANLNPMPLWKTLNSNPKILAACWVDPERDPRTVRVIASRITNFAVAKPGAAATCTFCGLQCVRPQILQWIPQTGFASLIDGYERARQRGHMIAGVVIPGSYWADAGTPERYLQVHRETASYFASAADPSPANYRGLESKTRQCGGQGLAALPEIRPSVCIAPTASVGKDVKLQNCVIWDHARIEPGSTITDAVIGRNCRVSGSVSGMALSAHHILTQSEREGVQSCAPVSLNELTAISLPARGSARSYIRLQSSEWSGILMRYDAARHENTLFAGIGRALRKARWPVPAIWADSATDQWALLENVGQESLGDRLASNPNQARADYHIVLQQLLQLHGRVTQRFRKHPPRTLPPFDASVYRYERNLFTNHYLARHEQLPTETCQRINNELARAICPLRALQSVYIHRDLQSSNIHWHHGKPVFIDFQGLRLGPAAYDVASLLLDPYVDIPTDLQDELLAEYARHANPDTFTMEAYRVASVQRLCQALGAYARLATLPGCERFSAYIPIARNRLGRALDDVSGLRTLKQVIRSNPWRT